MENKKLLIVDDDIDLCQTIKHVFMAEGMQVFIANDGREGIQAFFAHRPDLVLLDIRMPEIDGWELCRQIRMMSNTPVIMLTTLDEDQQVVRGLKIGADDFVTKPFSREVLLARVQAVFRRTAPQPQSGHDLTYHDGYLSVDLTRHEVRREGEPVRLSATEFRLLRYLLKHAGRVLTHQAILHNVWGTDCHNPEYVHVYLWHLRKKLEKDPRSPNYLVTEHGFGYRFVSHARGNAVVN
jgi:two-component system KDP operon response regulator KdpE